MVMAKLELLPVATQSRPVAGDLGGRLEHGALEGRGLADAAGES